MNELFSTLSKKSNQVKCKDRSYVMRIKNTFFKEILMYLSIKHDQLRNKIVFFKLWPKKWLASYGIMDERVVFFYN